jgi:hypothetical protein
VLKSQDAFWREKNVTTSFLIKFTVEKPDKQSKINGKGTEQQLNLKLANFGGTTI